MARICSARCAILAYYEANVDTITFNTSLGDRNIEATYNHEQVHRHLTLASTSGLIESLVSKAATLSESGEGSKLHLIITELLRLSYDVHEGVAVYGSMLLEAAKNPGEPKLMYAQLPRSYRDAVDIVAKAFEPVTKITSAHVMYHYSILLSCGRVALDVPNLADLSALRGLADLMNLIARDSPDARFWRILEIISGRQEKQALRGCISRFLSSALGRNNLDVFSTLSNLRAAGATDVDKILIDLATTLDREIRRLCPEMGDGGSHAEKASAANSVIHILSQEYPAAGIIRVSTNATMMPRFKTAALTASPSIGPPYGYRTVDQIGSIFDSYHAHAEAPNGFFVFCRIFAHALDKPLKIEIVGNELGFQAVNLRQRSAMLLIDIGPDSRIGKSKAMKLYEELEKRFYGQADIRLADALIRALAGLRLFLYLDLMAYRALGGLGLEPATWPGRKLVVFDSYNSVMFEAQLKECTKAGPVSVRIIEIHEGTTIAVAHADVEPTVYYCIAVPRPLAQAWGTAISKISGVDVIGTAGAKNVFSEADMFMGLFFHYVITKDSYVLEPEPASREAT